MSTTVAEPQQRIVPSGKVYRQIFDAEVQLVRALEGKSPPERSKAGNTTDKKSSKPATEDKHLPVVHDSDQVLAVGMLTDRQCTWVDSFPNEGDVENPVLFKFFSEEGKDRSRKPESSLASKEVQGLPDILDPAKKGSDIIERIAESRRQRHDAALEDMNQELGLISADLEPQIQAAGEELMRHFHENNEKIDELMSRIAKDEDLIPYTEKELKALWDQIENESVIRQQWIKELDENLRKLEKQRMDNICEVFRKYADELRRIAYLMPPDLQRLLDKESQSINQTVLSNRRAYADLYARLMMADIEREKHLHTQWRSRFDDWKELHTEIAINRFREYMESTEVVEPPNVQQVLDKMYEEQESLNKERLELITSLRNLNPPASTKTRVYQWNEKLTNISKSIDELSQKYFNQVYSEYEVVCQKCLERVEALKHDLIDRGVCAEEKVQEVVADRCLPLVGERQTIFEKQLEAMDKELEQHNIDTLNRLKSLFKYSQGAAHVWDIHELGLAKQERALQEKLDQCRLLHDTQNQDREANLDILMDKMRQDANEKALEESLKKVLEMLSKIKEGYYQFHASQLEIIDQYPEMVDSELKRYDEAVCKFFGVNRKHPDELEKEAKELELQQEAEAAMSRGKGKPHKRPKSQASSRASADESLVESSLPLAVSEVLSTSKGTLFYVLTVAGEHGVPDEGSPRDPEQTNIFLTQADEKKELPPYLKSVNIDEDFIMDIKKTIRMNFLDHLENWCEEAEQRARSVVVAKREELNSELDLRLHLHEPRAKRAEFDVHNVRAAELVMHSERVSRHCKGINQALTELKQRFGQMTDEHNQLALQFRDDIEALEIVFINATKSAKLIALSSQLQIQQEKYMDKIRASLRQFRQHLDETLQMLRESNARFIKSFRVFSDGGNFCLEEIDEYRKKLEKMAQKIDSSEGFIMADLEGMESKRLEQASKVAREFEDRFKHHMVDLVFMEKIARWLTNTQVKIKAEVADSNSQAQKLAQHLEKLDRRIDACEQPNLDKEQITPTQLNDFVKSILDDFHNRSIYLDCQKELSQHPASATLQGNPALGARVAFLSDSIPPVSRPGKQPQEDPSVSVIKNILKTQKDNVRFGLETNPDGELSGKIQHQPSFANLQSQPSIGSQHADSKSRQQKQNDADARQKTSNSKPGTASNSVSNEKVTRAASGTTGHGETVGSLHAPLSTDTLDVSQHSLSGTSALSGWHAKKKLPHILASSLRSKPGKIDKKYYVFGEFHEEGEETNLIGRIKRILREALDGLLSAAELYYRQKGTRPVTRPQALQETLDECAHVITQKLQSYHGQTDEYHNQCLQEFRSQLSTLEDHVARVPDCVIRELVVDSISVSRQELGQLEREFDDKLNEWEVEKRQNETELRPALGHPQNIAALQSLCEKEEKRRQAHIVGVEEHSKKQQELILKHGQEFVDNLAKTSEHLLLQFDNLLTIDDVKKGRVPPVKFPTSELIRRKYLGRPLDEEEEVTKVARGKNTWPGLPKNELVLPGSEQAAERKTSESTPKMTSRRRSKASFKKEASSTASVTTAKTTLGHTATVQARDNAYQEYKQYFNSVLASINEVKQKHLVSEERWKENWDKSVEKIKALF